MRIIGLLFRRVAGQLDDSCHKTPWGSHGQTGCHAACISSDWLQSIRSLGEPSRTSRIRVIASVSPVSPLSTRSTWLRSLQPNEERRNAG